jgi:hypothetical protein
MGGTCSTCGGEERCIQFLWENLSERDHLEEPGVDERIILKWIFSKYDGVMGLIDLAQERDR